MRLSLLVLCLVALTPGSAQPTNVDSLFKCLKTAGEDTHKVYLYEVLSHAYLYSRYDSAYYFARNRIELSQRLGYLKGQSYAYSIMASHQVFTGNYPDALNLGLTSLKLAEKTGDPEAEADAMNALGGLYYFQKDYRRALDYFFQTLTLTRGLPQKWKYERALSNIGDCYLALRKLDSALYYSDQAYHDSKADNDRVAISDELNNLASVYAESGNHRLAHQYYSLGMEAGFETREFENYCVSSLGDAKLFLREGRKDSALHFAYQAKEVARTNDFMERELEASRFIESIFESEGRSDSSFKYLKLTIVLQDSVYSQERLKDIQTMTFEENVRQQQLADQKRQAGERTRKNLQLIAIALFIPVFFLLVVFLYRVKVKPRIIEFLAIMNLLLVFEFVTDLTFPWISDWTKESPLWEMLILVLIAAFLEPINFKVESWVKTKLAQRNVIGPHTEARR